MLTPLPLVLDLDGTLIHTDTFHEMMAYLLNHKPLLLLRVPFWLLKGRPYAKAQLVKHTEVRIEHLPYNTRLLAFAQQEKRAGRLLVLATGTDQTFAQRISDYLGLFQEVIGTQGEINMTGHQKRKALLDRFGPEGFDYAGDSAVDRFVWQVSHKALIVCPKWGVLKQAHTLKEAAHLAYYPREMQRFVALCLALRPFFWAVNLLTFSLSGFIGLSLLSSGLLISGDLFSLEMERTAICNTKSVFAKGHLHLMTAFFLAPLLILSPLILIASIPNGLLSMGLYIPFFIGLDRFTRYGSQPLRWAVLSLFQILMIVMLGFRPEILSLLP